MLVRGADVDGTVDDAVPMLRLLDDAVGLCGEQWRQETLAVGIKVLHDQHGRRIGGKRRQYLQNSRKPSSRGSDRDYINAPARLRAALATEHHRLPFDGLIVRFRKSHADK